MIQCVGSRNTISWKSILYWSMLYVANKNAGILKDDYPDAEVTIAILIYDTRT
jgi:heterodisulfide reductase subunit A-like polyferredoxin